MKKFERRSKDERRRVLLNKNHELSYRFDNNKLRKDAVANASVLSKAQDLNRRFIAAFLALVFALTTLVVGVNLAARADDPDATTEDGSNLVLNKTISANADGTYKLQLSAYAKGQIKDVTEQVPTDFILILDQSSSMAKQDMPTRYDEENGITKNWHLEDIGATEEDTPYYVKGDDGNFYRVYKKWGVMYERYAPDSIYVNEVISGRLRWFQPNSNQPATLAGAYYFRPKDGNTPQADYNEDGRFYPVTVTARGAALHYKVYFDYQDRNGNPYRLPAPSNPDYWNFVAGEHVVSGDKFYSSKNHDGLLTLSLAYNTVNNAVHTLVGNDNDFYAYAEVNALLFKITTGMYIHQTLYTRHPDYNKLCYKDKNGVEHELIHSTFCGSDGTPYGGAGGTQNGSDGKDNTNTTKAFWHGTLYTAVEAENETRLQALNSSLKEFVNTVSSQQDSFGKVDHRIAMVGFCDLSSTKYENNELLTGVEITDKNFETGGINTEPYSLDNPVQQHNGALYPNITSEQYANALVSTKTQDGKNSIYAAIDAVTAFGGTRPDVGFEMANEIIANRGSSAQYTSQVNGETKDRNTVVIFFTDGRPGVMRSDTNSEYQIANKTVKLAKTTKQSAKVYSIAMLGESDGNPLIYHEGDYNGEDQFKTQEEARANPPVESDSELYYSPLFFTSDTVLSRNGSVGNNARYWMTRRYFFRTSAEGNDGYPEQDNDTIADFMETVSSKYPLAEAFGYPDWDEATSASSSFGAHSQYNSYNAMIEDVRKDVNSEDETRYYYNATSGADLSSIFTNIAAAMTDSGSDITLDETNSYLQDVISSNFIKPTGANAVTAKTYNGRQEDGETEPTFDTEPTDTLSSDHITWDGNTLMVDGFNYSDEYIAEGKAGKKLVVTIDGLVPNGDVTSVEEDLASNADTSGIIKTETVTTGEGTTTTETPIAEFTSPTIARYKYILNVGNEDTDAVFGINYTLSPKAGTTLNDQAIVLRNANEAKRYDQLTSGQMTAAASNGDTSVGNTNTMYVEYITAGGADGDVDPADYTLTAAVTAASSDAANYTYYLSTQDYLFGDDQEGNELTNSNVNPASFGESANANGNLYITSSLNNHNVKVLNQTVKNSEQDEDYSDSTKKFPINLTLNKEGSAEFANKAVQGTDQNGNPVTVQFTNGAAMLNLAHDEFVTLSLPVGYSVTVEDASPPSAYSTTYKVDNGEETPTSATTDTNADRTIIVKHERNKETIATTGVEEDSTFVSAIMYTLAGVLTLSSGAYYVYAKRKKVMQ